MRKLFWAYYALVGLAALAVAWQALAAEPLPSRSAWGWTPAGWQPSWAQAAFWTTALGLLVFVPRFPVLGPCVYVAIEHSARRYGPELEFVFRHGLPELAASLTAAGVWLWWRTHPDQRVAPNRWIVRLMLALAVWAMISTAAAVIRSGSWDFDARHHPVRYLDGLLLLGSAAYALRRVQDFALLVLVLAAAISWRAVWYSSTNYLDSDLGELVAITFPLLLMNAWLTRHWGAKIVSAAGTVYFAWLIISIQSRGPALAAVVALILLWLQATRRWLILLASLPALAVGGYLVQQSGIWNRIQGSLPGGSSYGSVADRFLLWKAAWAMTLDAWLLGVGPSNYPKLHAQYQADLHRAGLTGHVADNNFLSVSSELGLPGLALYVALFGAALLLALWRGRDLRQKDIALAARALAAGLAAYLVAGTFVTRYDQGLAYLLVGCAAAWSGRSAWNNAPTVGAEIAPDSRAQ